VRDDGMLELCEAFGRLFEDSGSTRIAGRIVGWLMLCDPPEQTQADLVAALGASKGSVSTELRLLEHRGTVERTSLPGDRRNFYRIAIEAWPELVARQLRVLDEFVALADAGLSLLDAAPPARRARLVALRDTYVHLRAAFRGALERVRHGCADPRRRHKRGRSS